MSECPVFKSADIIGKKWTIALLQEIALNGKKGFNIIFKRMGKISPKILAKRLKELEDEGVIKREYIIKEKPIRAIYILTEKGNELLKIIQSLKIWNVKYSNVPIDCQNRECVNCELYQTY